MTKKIRKTKKTMKMRKEISLMKTLKALDLRTHNLRQEKIRATLNSNPVIMDNKKKLKDMLVANKLTHKQGSASKVKEEEEINSKTSSIQVLLGAVSNILVRETVEEDNKGQISNIFSSQLFKTSNIKITNRMLLPQAKWLKTR